MEGIPLISRKQAMSLLRLWNLAPIFAASLTNGAPPQSPQTARRPSDAVTPPVTPAPTTRPNTPVARDSQSAATRHHLRAVASPATWRDPATREFFVGEAQFEVRERCTCACCLGMAAYVPSHRIHGAPRTCAGAPLSLFSPAVQRTSHVLNEAVAAIYWRHKGNNLRSLSRAHIDVDIKVSVLFGKGTDEPLVAHYLFIALALALVALGIETDADGNDETARVVMVTRRTAGGTTVHRLSWHTMLSLATPGNREVLRRAHVRAAAQECRRMYSPSLGFGDDVAATFRTAHLLEVAVAELEAGAEELTDPDNCVCHVPEASRLAMLRLSRRALSCLAAGVDDVRRSFGQEVSEEALLQVP